MRCRTTLRLWDKKIILCRTKETNMYSLEGSMGAGGCLESVGMLTYAGSLRVTKPGEFELERLRLQKSWFSVTRIKQGKSTDMAIS
jgi:hypothetical protein